jgi:hypothetical protein
MNAEDPEAAFWQVAAYFAYFFSNASEALLMQ